MRLSCIALSLIALFAVGCANVKTPPIAFTDDGHYLAYKGGKGLVAQTNSPIPDVPMPVGFKPVASRCSSSTDGRVRTVNHTYQGRAKFADAVQFYTDHLRLNRWELTSRSDQSDGATRIEATKGNERIEIYAQQGTLVGAIDSSVTTVLIIIGPRG